MKVMVVVFGWCWLKLTCGGFFIFICAASVVVVIVVWHFHLSLPCCSFIKKCTQTHRHNHQIWQAPAVDVDRTRPFSYCLLVQTNQTQQFSSPFFSVLLVYLSKSYKRKRREEEEEKNIKKNFFFWLPTLIRRHCLRNLLIML